MAAIVTSPVAQADFKQIALETVKLGIRVVPIPPREKACKLPEWQKKRTTDLNQIEKWAREYPNGNCGAVADPDTVWMLDDDQGNLAYRIEEETDETFPFTRCVRSAKGRHYYFKQTDASRKMGNRKVPGLFDAQVNGKYVVAAGSVHPSGVVYEVLTDPPMAEAPDWLTDWVIKASTGTTGKANGKFHEDEQARDYQSDGVISKNRNDKLFDIACAWRNTGVSEAEALTRAKRDLRFEGKFPQREIETTVRSAYRYPKRLPLTQQGNAERLVASHGPNIRYCLEHKDWFTYADGLWKRDQLQVVRFTKATIRDLLVEAAKIEDANARRAMIAFERACESVQHVNAAMKLAESEPGIAVSVNDFDRGAWLLNCKNGTVDLMNGKLRAHRREDLLSKQIPVAYDASARCPTWERHLEKIMAGSAEKIRFLRAFFGYCLLGENPAQVVVIFYGSGANGKDVTVRVMSHLLGDYAMTADFSSFMASKRQAGAAKPDLVDLPGKRFVTASEGERQHRLGEGFIKALTGGSAIKVRGLYEREFGFIPVCKLVLCTNHLPRIMGQDSGIWRRLRCVPFTVEIPEKERLNFEQYVAQLCAEAPGILNWALEGLADYRENGLPTIEEIVEATQDYRRSQDLLAQFLNDCCYVGPSACVLSNTLYGAYRMWAEQNGEWSLTGQEFRQTLKDRFKFTKKHIATGQAWIGLGLREEKEAEL